MSCANTKCEWHRRDGGCKLFDGKAWERCRQSVKSAPAAKPKTTTKGQAK